MTVCIISIAQQASPKVAGQIELERAQAIALSTVVVSRLLVELGLLGVAQVAVDLVRGARRALDRASGRWDQRHSSAPFFQM